MRDEKNMPPHIKGGPLVEKNMKETFCCLMNNTLHPMNVLTIVTNLTLALNWMKMQYKLCQKVFHTSLAQIFTKKISKSTTMDNILFI
jgi:hypothetical protein